MIEKNTQRRGWHCFERGDFAIKTKTSVMRNENAIHDGQYSINLKTKIDIRIKEMQDDDNSHYLIYRVLGITQHEGKFIDEYQNKGRFLYKYAGSFLEEVAILCFEEEFENAKRKVRIKII